MYYLKIWLHLKIWLQTRQESFQKAQAESKVKILLSLGNTLSSPGGLIIISADISQRITNAAEKSLTPNPQCSPDIYLHFTALTKNQATSLCSSEGSNLKYFLYIFFKYAKVACPKIMHFSIFNCYFIFTVQSNKNKRRDDGLISERETDFLRSTY